MTAFNVNITFSGLMCLVPNRPWDSINKPDQLDILIPESRNIQNSIDNRSIRIHDFSISFDNKNLNRCPGAPSLNIHHILRNKEITFDITFASEPTTSSIDYDYSSAKDELSTHTSGTPTNDLLWLMKLNKVLDSTSSKIDSELLTNDPNSILNGRIKIHGGRLDIIDLGTYIWKVKNFNNQDYIRRFANKIKWSISNVVNYKILLKDISKNFNEEIVLQPINNNLDFEISNVCCINPRDTEPSIARLGDQDIDYLHYLKLMSNNSKSNLKHWVDSNRLIPVPFVKELQGPSIPSGSACIISTSNI